MATDSLSMLEAIEEDSLGLLIQSSLAEQENRDNIKKAKEISENVSKLELTAGVDRALIAQSQGAAELSAQKAKLKIANAAGVDPTAAMDSLTETISQLQVTQQKTRESLQDYNAKREKGVFNGGPLNWISNLVDIETAYRNVEVGAEQAAILADQVTQINNVVQQSAITQNAIKQSLNEADIVANNNLILTEAQLKARAADLEALKYNSALINNAKEASKERLGVLYNLRQSQISEEQLRRSLDALAQQKKEFDWRVEEKKVSDKAKAEAKEMDEYIIEMISTGRAVRGAAPLDSRGVKTMLQIFKAGGAGSKEMYADFQTGERSKTIGIPSLGATPAEALDNLKILGTTVAAIREETMSLLKDAETLTQNNKLIDPKNKPAVEQDFNKNVNTLVREQFRLIKPNSGNIFDVGDLRSYLGNSTDDKMGVSTLKNMAISQKLLIPAIEANQPMNDPRVVIQMAIAAVKKGTISSSDYLELSDIYRRANEINQSSLNLLGLGIVPPNNGKNYFIKMGPFGGTLDVTDPTALARQLSIELASPFTKGGPVRRSSGFN